MFVPGHHGPCHPGEFVGERDGSDLGGSPRQQSSEPGPMPGAVDLGIANDGERARREQTAQIAIALLADTDNHYSAIQTGSRSREIVR